MEMEKEEAGEDEDDEDYAEEEETNAKIEEIKKPKRKPDEDESDLDSSRYYFNWPFYIYTLLLYKNVVFLAQTEYIFLPILGLKYSSEYSGITMPTDTTSDYLSYRDFVGVEVLLEPDYEQ